MEMHEIKTGDIISEFVMHNEGVQFDLDDSGATLLVFMANPTQSEIEQFSSGKRFEIRFVELSEIVILTIKMGNLDWMDAPYSIHLSRNLTKIELPKEGKGIALTVMLVDAVRGEVKTMRLIGLSENFSKSLVGSIMEQKMEPFAIEKYAETLKDVFLRYPTKDLVKMSKAYFKING